jgi:hypothetical protein
MITNRIWCAAPGSVDAVGKSLEGCRRLRPHHEDHQLGVRVPTTERTARVGPPSPLLSSPPPLAPTNAACRTLSSNRPHCPVFNRSHFLPLNTQCGSAFATLSARPLVASSVFLAFPTFFLKPTRKNILLRGSRRGPACRGPVWEDAIGAPTSQTRRLILWRPIRSLCASLQFHCDPTALKTDRSRTARSMFPQRLC